MTRSQLLARLMRPYRSRNVDTLDRHFTGWRIKAATDQEELFAEEIEA